MKKIFATLTLCVVTTLVSAQSFTLSMDLGVLKDSSGNILNNQSLLQVIASPDAIFGDPTDSSFLAGNDVLLYAWGFDSATTGEPGVASFSFQVDLTQFAVTGYNLAVRWFPTLTTSDIAPGFATFYGEYGFNQDATWVAPAQGNTINLQLLTAALGGPVADALGQAASQTPIPEPSTDRKSVV